MEAPEPVATRSVPSLVRGLYNPHTKEGTLLVATGSGASILASPYTTAIEPNVAHAALAPLRCASWLFGVSFTRLSNMFPGTSVERKESGMLLRAPSKAVLGRSFEVQGHRILQMNDISS